MQFKLDAAQRIFERAYRNAMSQVWFAIGDFVEPRLSPFRELERRTLDLEADLDAEVPEADAEKVARELSGKLVFAAEQLAAAPFSQFVRAIRSAGCDEVTVPAGCDPLDPAEIHGAVKRGLGCVRPDDGYPVYLIVPAGAEPFFQAAFPGPGPASIAGSLVRILGSDDLIERADAQRVALEMERSATTTDHAADPALALLRRTPWYVVTGDLPECTFHLRDDPKLVGPKLAVEWTGELAYPDPMARVVRVSASPLTLASAVPAAARAAA